MTDEGEKVGFSRARLIAHTGHERDTQFIETNTCFLVSARKSHLTTHKNSDPPSIKFLFPSMVSLKEKEFIIEYWRGQDSYPARGQNEAHHCTYSI